MGQRREMIDTLARAATGPLAVSPAILADFESARQEFSKLSDAELAARCEALRTLDQEGTDYEVVFIGEEQHFQMRG